jgi:hypothetical protein
LRDEQSIVDGVGRECATRFAQSAPFVPRITSTRAAWEVGAKVYRIGNQTNVEPLRAVRTSSDKVTVVNASGERVATLTSDEFAARFVPVEKLNKRISIKKFQQDWADKKDAVAKLNTRFQTGEKFRERASATMEQERAHYTAALRDYERSGVKELITTMNGHPIRPQTRYCH